MNYAQHDKLGGKRRLNALACLVGLLLAAFLIYLPSELGAALTIAPDSSEYSICLANLFEHGRFGFTLNGEWYPSRYAPWFSLLCLTPAYFLSGGNVLCFHWAILISSLVLLVVVWKMGVICGLGKFAVLPPILLVFTPDFVFYSRVVMTEIPYTMLFSVLALVFVGFAKSAQPSSRLCVGVGVLVACTGMVRFTGYALIIPFVVAVLARRTKWQTKIAQILTMAVPIAVAMCMGLIYNWMVFGSLFRNGYNYWMPVPCDFPSLMFNWSNVFTSVAYFLKQPMILITLACIVASSLFALYVMRIRAFNEHMNFLLLEGFVLVHAVVLSVMYLGYYWPDTRFFISISICSILLFFVVFNELLARFDFQFRLLLKILFFISCLTVVVNAPSRYLYMTAGRPIWLCEAQISGAVLPAGSIVLQKGDSNVLDYFGLKDKGLFLFHVNRRNFDYVAQMIAPKRITGQVEAPESFIPLIIPELVESGICGMPFPVVFEERPDFVKEFVSKGKRVFFLQDMYFNEEFVDFKNRVERMGLALRLFGVWKVPEVSPNPIRHLYDKLLFPGYSMDFRPEITVAYYEVVQADATEGGALQ